MLNEPKEETVGMTQRERVRVAWVVSAFVIGCGAGMFVHAGGSLVFVELIFSSAIVAAIVSGYFIGRSALDDVIAERNVVNRSVERHAASSPATIYVPTSNRSAGLRFPVVTRPGDPEEDERETPGPQARPRPPIR